MMNELNIDITSGASTTKQPTQNNIEPGWRTVLNRIRQESSTLRIEQELAWFGQILTIFKDRQGFLRQKRFTAPQELLMKWSQVGDMPSHECTRLQPPCNIRYTLSYITQPLSHCECPPPADPFLETQRQPRPLRNTTRVETTPGLW